MKTKTSTENKNERATANDKNEVKRKLTQSTIGLQVQDPSIGRAVPDLM